MFFATREKGLSFMPTKQSEVHIYAGRRTMIESLTMEQRMHTVNSGETNYEPAT